MNEKAQQLNINFYFFIISSKIGRKKNTVYDNQLQIIQLFRLWAHAVGFFFFFYLWMSPKSCIELPEKERMNVFFLLKNWENILHLLCNGQ
jgi:hypothetical protein